MKEKKKTAKGLTSCWFYICVGCSDCLSFIFFDSESYLNPSKGREHLCSSFVSAFNVCLNKGLRGRGRGVLSRRQHTGLINPVSFSSCSGFVCYSYKFLSAAQPKMFILPPVTFTWPFPCPVLMCFLEISLPSPRTGFKEQLDDLYLHEEVSGWEIEGH